MLEKEIIKHRLIKRTGEAYERSRSKKDLQNRLNQIDKELGEYIQYAEKKFRKIKSGRIPFSPKAALWICRLQVYWLILKYHAGRIRNRGNLKKAARRCDISNPLSIPIREVYLCIKTCASQCDYFWKNRKYYCRKHLYNCLDAAKEREDKEAARKILDIIQREKERGFWRRMNYAIGKPRGGAYFKVQVEKEDGTIDEFTDKDDLHQAIWDNIHRKRFILAEDAPLCSGLLCGQFGYNAVSLTARLILNRTYSYPPDFHKAAMEILMECARIRLNVPKDSVNTTITPKDWERHWKRVKEQTLSSISGRHFGHHKAGLRSPYITYLHVLKSTLIQKSVIVLNRWARGLSVMLEKMFGCVLITKLRSILLMKADFNATNKIEFGICMLENVRKYKLMPEEVFSKRNHLAEDGTLSKKLFFDIVQQSRQPAGLAAVDADNCYNRIAHPMASMIFQAVGVPTPAIKSMLSMIQNMKFYLRMGYKDSQDYAGGETTDEIDQVKPQGMCQGNGASPALGRLQPSQ
jgi:hypothetical protein